MNRRPMNKSYSKKVFTRTAENVNSKNFRPLPQRGGYRL